MIQIQRGALEMLNELLCDPLGTLEKQNVVICALTLLSKQVKGQSKTWDFIGKLNMGWKNVHIKFIMGVMVLSRGQLRNIP